MTDPTPAPSAAPDEWADLRERYTAEPVPPCRVCGAELTIQRQGGGEPNVWACSPPDGVRFKDWHYGDSRFIQRRRGDSDVLRLLDELVAARAGAGEADAAVERADADRLEAVKAAAQGVVDHFAEQLVFWTEEVQRRNDTYSLVNRDLARYYAVDDLTPTARLRAALSGDPA